MTELQQLHQQYPRLTHAQANRLVQLHHQMMNPHANHSSARATAIAPDCRPSDRPDEPLLDGLG